MQAISLLSSSSAQAQRIEPSKVICIGRNYVKHIHELANEIPDEMVVFLKPNSAISSSLSAQHLNEALHYEAELCFLYQQGKFSAVALGLDLTKRATQSNLKKKGLPWERAKAFNGSAVFSQFVSIENLTEEQLKGLSLSLSINGELKQHGGVELMMYKPEDILTQLQTFLHLEDGDIVMTGTPKGVGVVNVSDSFSGQVLVEANNSKQTLLNVEWLAQ